ncbi:non-ribosomal peptide synthetase [Nocardia inohanensis]|uniref:non-ribosomal peptide synthetase n=1 Tax=Nocardia inohanensis TaxID=209246 RepID=UPI000831B299|nr:non-ribosomal peptide synthetase [Nocardia inohanensis]
MTTHHARPAAGAEVAPIVGIAVRLRTAPTDAALTGMVAAALGITPGEIGTWCRSVPFAATSQPAARLVRQRLRHPLGGGLRARLTCTRYPDGAADVVLLTAADPRPVLAELDGYGARSIAQLAEFDGRGADSTVGTAELEGFGACSGTGLAEGPSTQLDIAWGADHRVDELAAAIVATLARFVDTATLSVHLRTTDTLLETAGRPTGVGPGNGYAVCEVDGHGSIKDISSRLALAEPAVDTTDAGAVLRSVRITDYTGAAALYLPGDQPARDFDVVIRPGPGSDTVRLWVRGPAAESPERLRPLTRAFAAVYRQVRKSGPDLSIRDLEFAAPVHGIGPDARLQQAEPLYPGHHFTSPDPAPAPAETGPDARLRQSQPDRSGLGLASTEIGAVVAEFGSPVASGERVEQRVAGQATARPDAIAVQDGAGALTFRELDELSGSIAAGLLELGVLPGDFVVVAAAKSARLFAVMLGIWKCGAAYVPVDIEFPVERLHYIVEDSRARVAVVEAELVEQLPEDIAVVSIAELTGPLIANAALPQLLSGDAPAYAIYTSGTTGRPKGTVIAHRSALALIDALEAEFALMPDDRWSVFHSPAFDFSVWEIWGALATGGTAVVVGKDTARDPAAFHALLRDSGVTVLNQTPSAFAHLVHHDARAPLLESVRLVILGGEALQGSSSSAWLDRYPERRCRLVNMYGITETTVHVTIQPVSKQVALRAPSSVGRAIPGWRTAVFGPDLQPVAPGFPGEIWVAGAGLALYYSGNPALTAGRFVAGPDGQRWYRSGDLGRVRPDGTLEHLGRIDQQIKINGYRIELDEIRNSIRRRPGVQDAIVVCNANGRFATPRLDAYVVGDLDLIELRGMVERTLPAYMRPATYTPLPSIPLTTNGKADTARLPDPLAAAHPAADPVGITKTSAAQEILSAAWQTVLGAAPNPEDNFFLSGGNSLAAIHLSTELSDNGLPMQLMLLYRHPVFRDLATALEN